MNLKTFRTLVLFCSIAAAGFVAAGSYFYVAKARWSEQGGAAQPTAVNFTAPEATSNAFYIAGLFLALGGCFSLKASRAAELQGDGRETTDDPSH